MILLIACGTGACLIIAGFVFGTGALLTALGFRGVEADCQDHCDHCPGDHDTDA